LIEARADVNTANESGRTPVYIAASEGNPECLRMLIAVGADVTTPDNDRTTPLRIAEQYGNQQCVDMIEYKLDQLNNRPTKSAAFRR